MVSDKINSAIIQPESTAYRDVQADFYRSKIDVTIKNLYLNYS